VLAAVELDYQALLAANKVHVLPIDGLLADKFEATELPGADASPQQPVLGPGEARPRGPILPV